MYARTALLLFGCLLTLCQGQSFAGESCKTRDGDVGTCTPIRDCKPALDDFENGVYPIICSYNRKVPIVCCPRPAEQQAVDTSTGVKARAMCQKYSELVWKEEYDPALIGGNRSKVNTSDCVKADSKELIYGGVLAEGREFPHMAVIGYGDENDILWGCGGTLISDKFVLTAAHCLAHQEKGVSRWVLLGDLNLQSNEDDSRPQTFSIKRRERPKGYRPPSHYDDIALLELDGKVDFTAWVRPACLHTAEDLGGQQGIATGWGKTNWSDMVGSNNLMKVTLSFVPADRCNTTYKSQIGGGKLRTGIHGDTMVCAGEVAGKKDTCQGDSGGPLQVSLPDKECMFNVVGVTSFGLTVCGSPNAPAVYTRVSAFVPWIENIVWP